MSPPHSPSIHFCYYAKFSLCTRHLLIKISSTRQFQLQTVFGAFLIIILFSYIILKKKTRKKTKNKKTKKEGNFFVYKSHTIII
uniref:Uncharacterized protein n=1 Tax=Lutzomyia longipalpis TaxID=7200 RepID=A0A7G3B4G2_LUTLO